MGVSVKSHEIMLEQAARVAKLGYFIFNVREDILEVCSDSHAAIFGYTAREFTEAVTGLRGDMNMIHPEDIHIIHSGYERLHAGEAIELEYRIRHRSGAIAFIREFVAPEFDENGVVIRGLGSSIDITAAKREEHERNRVRRLEALGELTGGVAHDFNNLLAVVMGNAEIAQELSQDPDLDQCMREIIAAANRGGGLTRKLLNFAERAEFKPRRVDLSTEVAGVVETFDRTSLKHASLRTRFAPETLPVDVDVDHLQSVLLGLLINARDATDVGGEITLTTGVVDLQDADTTRIAHRIPLGQYACVEIADDGHGIPEALLSRVTEPFFTTKNRAEGSGLGLSMAAGFARQNDGALEVDSQLDVGTTVTLLLPLMTGGVSDTNGSGRSAAAARSRGRILLLDDEAAFRRLLARQLTREGFAVSSAASVEEGFLKLEQAEFDVAIVDSILPGPVRGLEFCGRLKAHNPATRTILITGYGAPDLMGQRPAVDCILHKPLSFHKIMASLEQALATRV